MLKEAITSLKIQTFILTPHHCGETTNSIQKRNQRCGRSTYVFKRCDGGAITSVVGVAIHVQNLFPIH